MKTFNKGRMNKCFLSNDIMRLLVERYFDVKTQYLCLRVCKWVNACVRRCYDQDTQLLCISVLRESLVCDEQPPLPPCCFCGLRVYHQQWWCPLRHTTCSEFNQALRRYDYFGKLNVCNISGPQQYLFHNHHKNCVVKCVACNESLPLLSTQDHFYYNRVPLKFNLVAVCKGLYRPQKETHPIISLSDDSDE